MRCARVLRSVVCAVALASPAAAQRSVTVLAPTDNPLRDGIPAFTVVADGFPPADMPLRFTLQVGTNFGFATGIVTDTTVSASGTRATIAPRHVLPERTSVYWRGVVTTAAGQQVNSDVTGPRITATWLTLLAPNNPNGSIVTSKRPTFTWSSAHLDPSAGKWQYEIRVVGPHGEPIVNGRTDITTWVPTLDLEGNTSYRWLMTAWTLAGDTTRVSHTVASIPSAASNWAASSDRCTIFDHATIVNTGIRSLPLIQPALGESVVNRVDVKLCACRTGGACLCTDCQCGPGCTCHQPTQSSVTAS